MQWLKQSTGTTVSIGPCLDSAGAEFTTLVIGELTLTKNGSSAAMSGNTFAHTSNGHYDLTLTTANTDTLGRLRIRVNKTGYQIPTQEFMVLPATVFDALVTNATTAVGGLCDVKRIAGIAPSMGASLTFPTVIASPTNITAGTITNVTNQPSVLASGTLGAVGNSPTTLHLNTSLGVDNSVRDRLIVVRDVSTGLYASAWIYNWSSTGTLATLWTALPFTPQDNVDTWVILSNIRPPDHPDLLINTTIATLASQTVFTLTEGSPDNIYVGRRVIIRRAIAINTLFTTTVQAYNGTTKQVTLAETPLFTISVGDNVNILANDTKEIIARGDAAWLTATGFSVPGDEMDLVDVPNPTAITAIQNGLALAATFTGITSLADWLRRVFRKDAGTAGMLTAETEIQTGGTATFTGADDSLEAIKDNSAWNTATGFSTPTNVTDARDAVINHGDTIGLWGATGGGGDVTSINGSTDAAVRLALSAGQIIPGTVDTSTNGHTPTSTEFQAGDITEATSNHFKDRIIIFTSGSLSGQATSISSYLNVGGIGQFTVVAMTEAPSDGDTFIII